MDQKEPSQKGSACSRALLSSLLQGSGSLQPTCRKSAPGSPHLSLSHQVPGTWVPLNSDHLGLTLLHLGPHLSCRSSRLHFEIAPERPTLPYTQGLAQTLL